MVEPVYPPRLVPTDEDYPDTLEEAARAELEQLWSDLCEARRNALRGGWSIQCENVTYRIVALSRLAGPTSWGDVDMELVRSGLYERIYREAGISYPPVDWDDLARAEQQIGGMHHGA